ncbi:hypothetical protein [uncultured Eubacterium sp.]|uniref:hypothetical protein n=1 Tax=uncultured Eubacterium sp. TaxID=165185 RepID=UPI0015B0D994|nr:hypothetical protein [uncultured Eubacterium sp.]
MISKKKHTKKFLALLLAFVLVLTTIPIGVFTSVFAATGDCFAVEVDGKKVYFYGVDSLEVDGNTVKYTGGDMTTPTIYIDGISENSVDESAITTSDNTITFNSDWLKSTSGWIAIQCDDTTSVPSNEPTVDVDKTAPEIADDGISGNPTSWTKEDITLIVNATDTETGVVAYSNDKTNWTTSNTFTVTENGTYSFYAKDAVGNISEGQEVTVSFIDKAQPTISVQINPDSWTNKNVELVVEAEDRQSGLHKKPYKMDDGEWTDSKTFVVNDSITHTFWVRDAAGNEISTTKTADKHDVVKPVIDSAELYYTVLGISWNKIDYSREHTSSIASYKVVLSSSDDNSGVYQYAISDVLLTSDDDINSLTTWKDIDNTSNANEFEVASGSTNYFYAKDRAGNVSIAKKVSLMGDDEAPVISNAIKSTEDPTNQPIEFTVVATDNLSAEGMKYAVSDTEYSVSNGDEIKKAIKELKWQTKNHFTIEDCKVHYFYALDGTGANISEAYKIQALNYNDSNPTINKISPEINDSTKWTNNTVTVSIDAESKNSEGNNFDIVGYIDFPAGIPDKNSAWQTDNTFLVNDCKEHRYFVIDSANKISEVKTYAAVNYDNNAPELNGTILFKQKNDGFFARIANKLTFGRYFNKQLVITVPAIDNPADGSNVSGIVSANFIFKDTKNNTYTFEAKEIGNSTASSLPTFVVKEDDLPDDFKGTAEVILADEAGNTSTISVTTGNSDMGALSENASDFNFMIENTAPTIDSINPSATPIENVYKSDYEVDFAISDKAGTNNSGIAVAKIEVNGVEVANHDYQKIENTLTESIKLKTDVSNKSIIDVTDNKATVIPDDKWDNGKLNYVVTVIDKAGNVNVKTENNIDEYSVIYMFDQTAPQITAFEFDKADKGYYKDGDTFTDIYEAVSIEDYGFYFKNTVSVKVSAEDKKNENETVASGLKSITVYLKDVNGTIYIVPSNNSKIKASANNKASDAVAIETTDEITFTIPQDFKGQIYAYATDKVENSPQSCRFILDNDVNSEGYAHPDGSIVETTSKHTDTSTIEFTSVEVAQGTQNNSSTYKYDGSAQADKVMDYETNVSTGNVPLYNKDISFGVKVTDSYSGIREVSYTIIEGNEKTKKTIKIDNTGAFDGSNEGWKITNSNKKDSDNNLVTEITNTIAVSGNYNDMVLLVELTDRAGNKSYDYYVFGIDKTAPEITVTYDNNSSDTKSGDGNYFSANRTATIVVKERNFNTDQVKFTLKNAEGDAPKIVDKGQTKNDKNGNGDGNEYTYKITYSNDGVYSFKVAYTDRATNKASVDTKDSVAPYEFTLDKMNPTISVSYDNNEAQNGKYFKASRTATITIVEHNFDVNRVTITGTASLDGNAVKFPDASWLNSGDTHVATIKYDTDADYTFDISMDDMAGNKSNEANYGSSVAPKDFVVDTTIDKPVIGGVENGNSYKDSVLPKIDFSDINFKDVKVTLLRTRKDEIDKDVTSDYINVSTNDKGGSFAATEDTFKKIQENDGIYTLSVQITDKAENTSSDEVTFTVNRFGSVYSLGTYLSNDLNDKYVQSIDNDIVITEYNPDRLVEGNLDVVVTRDGSPVEYGDGELTISPVVNELAKIGSSGWYQYEYTISKNVFTDDNGNPIDGIYKVYVGSEDTVGNKSENISYDESSVLFRLDHTAPTIKSVSGLDKKIVNADEQKVSYEVFDAIGIDSIDVYYYDGNGTRVDHIRSTDKGSTDVTDILSDLTNYTGSFTIGSSTTSEPVRIVIKDLAGNVTDTDSKDFDVDSIDFNRAITVSTNFFVRWFANKIVFGCSIAAIIAVGGGLAFFIAIRKRRKDEAITEEIKKKARGSKD